MITEDKVFHFVQGNSKIFANHQIFKHLYFVELTLISINLGSYIEYEKKNRIPL